MNSSSSLPLFSALVNGFLPGLLSSVVDKTQEAQTDDKRTVVFIVIDKHCDPHLFDCAWMRKLKRALSTNNIPSFDRTDFILACEQHASRRLVKRLSSRLQHNFPLPRVQKKKSAWRDIDTLLEKVNNYAYPFRFSYLTPNARLRMEANYTARVDGSFIPRKAQNIKENLAILRSILPDNPSWFGVELFKALAVITTLQTFQTVVNTEGQGPKDLGDRDIGFFMLQINNLF